jgi:hypothetical protein
MFSWIDYKILPLKLVSIQILKKKGKWVVFDNMKLHFTAIEHASKTLPSYTDMGYLCKPERVGSYSLN